MVVSPTAPLLSPRLLRSLVGLKQVIINAAHYLVLGDKGAYRFDPETPFLHMVSRPGPAQGAPWPGRSHPKSWGGGVFLLFPCPVLGCSLCPVQLLVPTQDKGGAAAGCASGRVP